MYKASSCWWNRKPPAGFRFSLVDAAMIAVCALATASLWPLLDEMTLVFPIVLGHFFLFCNIFRVPRKPELLLEWSFCCQLRCLAQCRPICLEQYVI